MGKLTFKQKTILTLLISIVAVYFFMRFFFGISLPFLLAFLVIWRVYPFFQRLSKRTHLKETWFLSLFVVLLVLPVLLLVYLSLSGSMKDGALIDENENILESELVESCVEKYNEWKEICTEYIGDDMMIKIQVGAVNSVKTCVSFFMYLVIFFASLFLFCKDFEKIKNAIDERKDNSFLQIAGGVLSYIRAFLKTQVVIFVVLSALVGFVLMALRVENAWVFGVLAGFLDALPFIGTGIVLVPLAVWLFLTGHVVKAVLTLVLYGACALIRELLEPRLIGKKVGIMPIILFASVFVGMQVFGTIGIIKGPLSVVIISEIQKVILAKENKV